MADDNPLQAWVVEGDTVALGTTTGNAFFSANRGDSWQRLSHHLPPVYALAFTR